MDVSERAKRTARSHWEEDKSSTPILRYRRKRSQDESDTEKSWTNSGGLHATKKVEELATEEVES